MSRVTKEAGGEGRSLERARIISVVSGKGGAGKTFMAAGLGLALGALGHRVLILDADLGKPDLGIALGVAERGRTLDDFFRSDDDPRRVEHLLDLAVEAVPEDPAHPGERTALLGAGGRMSLFVPGAGHTGAANLDDFRRQRMIRQLQKLDFDFILVDVSTGLGKLTLDTCLRRLPRERTPVRNESILVANPDDPAGLLDGGKFIRALVHRQMERRFFDNKPFQAILARADDEGDEKISSIGDVKEHAARLGSTIAGRLEELLGGFRVWVALNRVPRERSFIAPSRAAGFCRHFGSSTGIAMEYLGQVEEDEKIAEAARRSRPFLAAYRERPAAGQIMELAERLAQN